MKIDRRWSGKLASALVIAGIVWGSSQLAHAIPAEAATRLIVATTLAAAVGFSISTWVLPRFDSALSKQVSVLATFVVPTLLAISSAVLLRTSWLEPLSVPTYALPFATLVVAAWWTIAAAALLWMSKQTLKSGTSIVSAILFPAAAALVVPVYAVSHPAVWMQVAASASVIWIAVTRLWLKDKEADAVRAVVDGSMLFALVVAVVSSLLVTFSILFSVHLLDPVFGPAGFVISLLGAVLWCLGWVRWPNRRSDLQTPLPWPAGLSLLAGQFASLASSVDLVSGIGVIELTAAILCVASAASLVLSRSDANLADFFHIALVSVVIAVVAGIVGNRSEWMPWLALGGLTIGGLKVAFVGRVPSARQPLLGASRLLGWFVIVAGGMFLVIRIASGTSPLAKWTLLVVWSAVWVVVWRLICPDQRGRVENRSRALLAIPDPELATVLMIAVIAETILFTLSGRHSFQTAVVADPLLWGRVVAYVLVSISTVARAARDAIWSIAIGSLVAAASLVSVQLAIEFDASPDQRFVWAALPSGFAIAFLSHWLPAWAWLLARFADGSAADHLGRLVQSTWQVALAVAWLGGLSAVAMIVRGASAADTNLAIVAVALAAWAIAEMAEACNGPRLRHAAVTVALATIELWASVDSGETSHPVLTATMRWLVASVFTIPMLMFVFPKLLGDNLSSRWREAFHRGAVVAGVAAGCSLVSMLVMEARIRTQVGISGISLPMVIGVAVTLAALSILAGLIAILSGPGSSWRERIQLSDQQRMLLIVTAQLLGGITWLHLFLCKTDWAFVGLREYWPFIVMGLAFLSVGATEWARRRGDTAMSQTLSQTALYLPLVPVIGFWLSGWTDEFGWAFRGGRVRYDLLLAMGSVYYIAISAMWKGIMPRVSAIVLGNAAWWVVLVQYPGWSFLAHPQVWLIPPALCVLVAAQLYRQRLQPAVASGIRYASTLVIYISSTADMLLQQIGTNLAGPIILVLLALVGMAAGVVLRVRPFLYLGAMFVFLGVTSMVWHAHRAFDAVWPWWVFGITTGICLLAGLMAIEKNKPKLRQYAQRLATWQG